MPLWHIIEIQNSLLLTLGNQGEEKFVFEKKHWKNESVCSLVQLKTRREATSFPPDIEQMEQIIYI